jgi:hypothetical protein
MGGCREDYLVSVPLVFLLLRKLNEKIVLITEEHGEAGIYSILRGRRHWWRL